MAKDVNLRLRPDKINDKDIRKALAIDSFTPYRIIRKSIDARRSDIMVDLVCKIKPEEPLFTPMDLKEGDKNKTVIVVGSGPAGLFAALTLLEQGYKPIVLERGKDVHSRRLDIAQITRNNVVNSQSNYSFGEGGAGTYSDGKLFTRSKKRGDNIKVLNAFVQFGADSSILYETHPHIGTDKLPTIVENMRKAIINHGGEVYFQTQMTALKSEIINNFLTVTGCEAINWETQEHFSFDGPVILAIGNAARDTYEELHQEGVCLEAKSLALGVRLEHPQALIDSIQYHNPKGRGQFLPPAEYSFTTQVSCTSCSNSSIGVYSFCMCPGGFVVPAASDNNQVVVNGMSPSNRGSRWANSGMVVEYKTSFLGSEDFVNKNPLAMMDFQKQIEENTFEKSGRTQRAPSQRMVDFLNGKYSSSLPETSYTPGLVSCKMEEVLPSLITSALKDGFKVFGRQAKGFETNEAILIGSETRTSGPVRIIRDRETLESISHHNLYPCGEGAGYAGGIVSAAVDGILCAMAVIKTKK
ncbi:MAG: FAD-binding protein [Sphaerochaetaceae bacterium]|nr:FAD-binding protein [Sphaerochaetaceae bacterium]